MNHPRGTIKKWGKNNIHQDLKSSQMDETEPLDLLYHVLLSVKVF